MPKILALAAIALFSLPLSAEAARPPAGNDPDAAGQQEKPHAYRTNAEMLVRGLVAGKSVDQPEALPEEMVLADGTEFRILDRRVNDDGDYFAQIEFDASKEPGELDATLTYWVDEHELVKALYGVEAAVEEERLNLDRVSPAYARFEYVGGVAIVGPDGFIMPVKGARRTSPPGMRFHPILKRWKMHEGWDFAAPAGTPVMAAAAGSVIKAGWGNGYGKVVYLNHGKIETRYAHLSAILVKVKQKVKQAQVIGKVGSTGRSTGNHLHYERREGGRILDVPVGRRR